VAPIEEKVPGLQGTQPLPDEEENLPASHTEQLDELACETHPAGQAIHSFAPKVTPSLLAKRPAAHGKQPHMLSEKY